MDSTYRIRVQIVCKWVQIASCPFLAVPSCSYENWLLSWDLQLWWKSSTRSISTVRSAIRPLKTCCNRWNLRGSSGMGFLSRVQIVCKLHLDLTLTHGCAAHRCQR